ncbi:MAG: cytochrome c3 family protein [Planctomycetota bacterium]
MRAVVPAAMALLWLSLTAWTTFLQLAPPSRTTANVTTAGPLEPFKHGAHVPSEWLDPRTKEVWRDCRGCHRFDAEHLVSAPQQECDKCHIGTGKLQRDFDPDWQNDLGTNSTRTRAAYRHHTHAMLECRQCHKSTSTEFLFDDFDIRTGPGLCAQCHEQGRLDFASLQFFDAAAKQAAAQVGAESYAKKLVEVFAGPTGGLNTKPLPVGGDFDHGDHCGVQNGVLGTLLACVDCHVNITRATATEVGTGKIPAKKCGECHIANAAKVAAAPAAPAKRMPRAMLSLGTFAHGDHFAFQRGARKPAVCSEQAYTKIEQGCLGCHTYKPENPGRPGRDFPFESGKSQHRFGDCIGCHDQPAWQTGESATAPLHGSGWKSCASCHVFGESDIARRRLMIEVERIAERTFVFPANVHPDITVDGVARSDASGRPALPDCKDCHRAKVKELTTRLANKPFRHDSHLPSLSEPKHCLECHPTASSGDSSAQLASPNLRAYSLAGCTKCHWGGEVTESTTPGEQLASKKKTVEFPHGAHVTAGKQSCLECHAIGDGRDITTKPEASGCYQCHDHKTGGPTYEGLFDGRAASCAHCHHDETRVATAPLVVAIPPVRDSAAAKTDPRYNVEQTVFAGFADAQFHPLGMKCSECHKAGVRADGGIDPLLPVVKDHLRASWTASVHAKDGRKEPATCLSCHWKPAKSWSVNVQGADGTAAEKAFRLAPSSKATRDKFGSDGEGYPGERAGG